MRPAGFGRLTDAPATFVVIGARILDPAAGEDAIRDLAVVDGLIADAADAPRDAERFVAAGMLVLPGLCDLHTHLREPGDGAAENVTTGARAAARGGYTTVCAMPNTDPPLDEPSVVRGVLDAAAGAACRVRAVAAATRGRAGAEAADLAALARAGAVAISDDGSSVGDDALREVLERAHRAGVPLVEHAEDPALADGGVMRAGPLAARLGLRPWSPEAEVAAVERDIDAAAASGARLHLTHLSTRGAVEAVRRARAAGVSVTADVTPHHLALADTWVGGDRAYAWERPRIDPTAAYDAACRVNPPLASRDDAAALLEGVVDGTIDAIATDHAPHPPERKAVPFEDAAPGLIGLETALSLGLAAVAAGRLELRTLALAMSVRPAAIVGESRTLVVGTPADLVLVDPSARWRVTRDTLASRSTNTPLLGMTLPGIVRLTVADGRITHRSA